MTAFTQVTGLFTFGTASWGTCPFSLLLATFELPTTSQTVFLGNLRASLVVSLLNLSSVQSDFRLESRFSVFGVLGLQC